MIQFTRFLLSHVFILCFSVGFTQTSYGEIKKNLESKTKVESSLKSLSELCQKQEANEKKYVELGLRYSKKYDNKFFEIDFLLHASRLEFKENEITKSLSLAFEALELLEECPEASNLKGKAHMRLAFALGSIGSYEEAIKHRKEQLKLVEGIKQNKLSLELNNVIGTIYMKIEGYDSAAVYFGKALELAKESENMNRIAFSSNNIGLTSLELGKVGDARTYFLSALKYYSTDTILGYRIMTSVINANLAACYSEEGDYENADSYINESIKVSRTKGLKLFLSQAFVQKAQMKSDRRDYNVSNAYLDSASSIEDSRENRSLVHDLEIYAEYSANYKALNDYRNAFKYSQKYQEAYNSLYGKKKMDELFLARSAYQSLGIQNELKLKKALGDKQSQQIKSLEDEAKLSSFKIIIITLCGIVVLVTLSFFMYRLKRKNEIEKLSNELLSASNENKSKRLTESSLSLSRKKEFAEGLKIKISSISGAESKEISSIKLFIDNELQIDDSILEMEKYISELSGDFFVKLKHAYPNLNENDEKLCGLIRLNLSTKQIAIIKNITPESVKVSKNRLSKKLALPSGTILYDFLKGI